MRVLKNSSLLIDLKIVPHSYVLLAQTSTNTYFLIHLKVYTIVPDYY